MLKRIAILSVLLVLFASGCASKKSSTNEPAANPYLPGSAEDMSPNEPWMRDATGDGHFGGIPRQSYSYDKDSDSYY
jgi:hypothetical protein